MPRKRTADRVPFATLCRAHALAAPLAEYPFALAIGRRWRFDYAWPDRRVALEVEGGVFSRKGSRHTRGAGFRSDIDKYNRAALDGWLLLRVLPEQLRLPATFDMLRAALTRRWSPTL